MLGTFKPVAFEPYGRRRSSRRMPQWLVMLLLGAAAGVVGVLLVQQRVLPPRLSASESTALRAQLAQAEQERDRARAEAATAVQQRDAATAERKAAVDELAADRERTKNARADQEFLIASLPPDPRGGAVEVRAARFTRERGALNYEVLLTRGKGAVTAPGGKGASTAPGGKSVAKGGDAADNLPPLAGVKQFIVAGSSGSGERHITLEPIKINLGSHQRLRGSVPLPENFTARKTTISVFDRVGGKQLGMRVLFVG